MFGLSALGIVHMLISLVAVIAGAVSLIRDGNINSSKLISRVYLWTTIVTCVTGLFIFAHGGFGKAHVLSLITLMTLAIAMIAEKGLIFDRESRYVSTISYSASFFFHMIPGITETSKRLPTGAPLFANAEAPRVQTAIEVVFILFIIGTALQIRQLAISKTIQK